MNRRLNLRFGFCLLTGLSAGIGCSDNGGGGNGSEGGSAGTSGSAASGDAGDPGAAGDRDGGAGQEARGGAPSDGGSSDGGSTDGAAGDPPSDGGSAPHSGGEAGSSTSNCASSAKRRTAARVIPCRMSLPKARVMIRLPLTM